MTDKVIHPRSSRRIRSTVMVAAMLFGAAACGSDSKSSNATSAETNATSETTAAAATTADGGSTAAGAAVQVTETEFKIEISSMTLTPGAHTFDITNGGEFKHNITVEGPGVEEEKSDDIEPGQTGQLSVTLEPGTYEVYCSIPTHKGKGMDLMITVE